VFFMVLIVFVNGGSFGLWLAAGIAVFTLAHELGHAIAARSTGAEAEISLDFLAGYASYVPTRDLARWERAGIAVAGPATQIVLGLAVLVVMGVQPFDRGDVTSSNAAFAIWWSGPMLGLVNLFPVLPLDGGTIAATALDRLSPGRGHRIMATISLPLTLVGLVVLALDDRWRFLTPFLAVLLVLQLQSFSRGSTRDADDIDSADGDTARMHPLRRAEDDAWRGELRQPLDRRAVDGHVALSPWFRAHELLRSGAPEAARSVLVDDLVQPGGVDGGRWWPPRAATAADLEQLVALLPRPLPDANPYAATVLVEILLRIGSWREAADYGARAYARSPSAPLATLVARCVAALGEPDLAVRWLDAAALDGDASGVVADVIDNAAELNSIRWRHDVQAIRERAADAAR
jgi:Zn-dependent protease